MVASWLIVILTLNAVSTIFETYDSNYVIIISDVMIIILCYIRVSLRIFRFPNEGHCICINNLYTWNAYTVLYITIIICVLYTCVCGENALKFSFYIETIRYTNAKYNNRNSKFNLKSICSLKHKCTYILYAGTYTYIYDTINFKTY